MARKPPTRKHRIKVRRKDPGKQPAGKGQLRLTQVRSSIGQPPALRRTLEALGFKHHQDVLVKQDHPALRGMLYQVRFLVAVAPMKEGK